MKDIIAKLEVAEERSRELDAAIAELVGSASCSGGVWPFIPGSQMDREVFHYTTSLDAALTLVPEGAEYRISTLHGYAHVELPLNAADGPEVGHRDDGNIYLALCIAALKARNGDRT